MFKSCAVIYHGFWPYFPLKSWLFFILFVKSWKYQWGFCGSLKSRYCGGRFAEEKSWFWLYISLEQMKNMRGALRANGRLALYSPLLLNCLVRAVDLVERRICLFFVPSVCAKTLFRKVKRFWPTVYGSLLAWDLLFWSQVCFRCIWPW